MKKAGRPPCLFFFPGPVRAAYCAAPGRVPPGYPAGVYSWRVPLRVKA